MANRTWSLVEGLGRMRVLAGSFTPTTGSTQLNVSGALGFTVTRIATGSFKATFTDQYWAMHDFFVQYQPSGSSGYSIQAVPGQNDVRTAKTANFYLVQMSGSNTVNCGSPVDVNGTPYDRVSCFFILKNTSAPNQ